MNDDHVTPAEGPARRPPWNKGKLVGAKPPLRPHVWSIRTKLQIEGRKRDLALFNLAIDSKLRGCDVVAVRVDDVAPGGYAMDRATIRQKKTGRPVRFELTDQTRIAIDEYLRLTGRKPGQFSFAGRADRPRGSTRGWCKSGWPASGSTRPSSARTRCAVMPSLGLCRGIFPAHRWHGPYITSAGPAARHYPDGHAIGC
jgi:hypothetical protein